MRMGRAGLTLELGLFPPGPSHPGGWASGSLSLDKTCPTPCTLPPALPGSLGTLDGGPHCVKLGRIVLFSTCVYGRPEVKGSCSRRNRVGDVGASLGGSAP